MAYAVDTIELKKMMAEKKIKTTEEFSRKSGVNRNTLSDVLNEKIRPSTSVMDRIVITLDLTPEAAGRIFFAKDLRITQEKTADAELVQQ